MFVLMDLPVHIRQLVVAVFGEYSPLVFTTWKMAQAPGPVISFRQATRRSPLYRDINWGDLLAHCNSDVSFVCSRDRKPKGFPLVDTLPLRHRSPGIENFRGIVDRRKVVQNEQPPSNTSNITQIFKIPPTTLILTIQNTALQICYHPHLMLYHKGVTGAMKQSFYSFVKR